MKARSGFAVRASIAGAASIAAVLTGCSKGNDGVAHAAPETQAAGSPLASPGCTHAVCADNFFIDATPGDCTAGAACSLSLKLVATGDYHINDEYPYRFKADDAAGVEFLGKDDAGKGTFSKSAGDWQKSEEKAGVMTVRFVPAARGSKTVSGTLKLSVCSPQSCLLEQRQVASTIVAK